MRETCGPNTFRRNSSDTILQMRNIPMNKIQMNQFQMTDSDEKIFRRKIPDEENADAKHFLREKIQNDDTTKIHINQSDEKYSDKPPTLKMFKRKHSDEKYSEEKL